MLLLLCCWIIAGITAENPPTLHRRLKNSSLCLKARKSPSDISTQWSFGKSFITHNNKLTPSYKDKADYYPENNTLCIKNLTERDNGTYTASITDSNYQQLIETYKLIVYEAVPRPDMRMSAMPTSNQSAGLCNITVNCSIQHDWLFSICNGDSCRPLQESLKDVNITIFNNNRSVTCRGSNLVSTNSVSESIDRTCIAKSKSEHQETSQTISIITIAIPAIAVCVLLAVCVVYVAQRIFSKGHNHHQASPVEFIRSRVVEEHPQPTHRDSTCSSSSSNAEISYENVETVQGCQSNSQQEALGSKENQKVDTIYSSLEAPNAALPPGKSASSEGAKGNKEVREASTAQEVEWNETEQSKQTNTVYSVLQGPKNRKSQQHK